MTARDIGAAFVALAFALLPIGSSPTHAGGFDWPFTVVGYEQKTLMTAHIVLQPVGGTALPLPGIYKGCERIVLEVDYRPEQIWRRTWSRHYATRDAHRDALAMLATAHTAGESVRVGMMGSRGLPSGSERCSWSTRGLAALPVPGQSNSVFAFYHPI